MRRRFLLLSIPALALTASAIGLSGCSSTDEGAAQPVDAPAPTTAPASTAPEPAPVRETTIEMGAPGEFDLAPAPQQVDAGTVSFEVTNDGTIEHEVIVMRTDLDSAELPTDANGAAVESNVITPAAMQDEEEHHGLHVDAGDAATLTVDLPPGEYALICNLPGHYQSGMHANLTVG